MLITIDGCSGVGKTTLTDFLVNNHGFTELSFNRYFCQHLDTFLEHKQHRLRNNEIIRAASAFAAFREAVDVQRPFEGKFVCDHFWEPAFMHLYMETIVNATNIFPTLTNAFDDFMSGFPVGRPILSVWLDTPYLESCRRAAKRDNNKPKRDLKEVDCWRNFAFQLTNQLPYFRIIDATQCAKFVQNSVTRILEAIHD